MNLAKRLAETVESKPGPRCTLCKLLIDLSPEDADTLRQALAGNVFTSSQIADALLAEGHKVQRATVRRHRRGECLGTSG